MADDRSGGDQNRGQNLNRQPEVGVRTRVVIAHLGRITHESERCEKARCRDAETGMPGDYRQSAESRGSGQLEARCGRKDSGQRSELRQARTDKVKRAVPRRESTPVINQSDDRQNDREVNQQAVNGDTEHCVFGNVTAMDHSTAYWPTGP
jgi:hypothetical protein